jgi:hypothetical protein
MYTDDVHTNKKYHLRISCCPVCPRSGAVHRTCIYHTSKACTPPPLSCQCLVIKLIHPLVVDVQILVSEYLTIGIAYPTYVLQPPNGYYASPTL